MATKKRKLFKQLFWTILVIFIGMNIVAYFQAYKFTHFTTDNIPKTGKPKDLTLFQKMETLILGVNNPRPANKNRPGRNFKTLILQSNKKIECWYIKTNQADTVKGTVILCHGYGGSKSSLLDKAAIFDSLKYNTLLIDFMGSGGSEGSATTIGFKEAQEVETAYKYLKRKNIKNIYLFGTSMGAVAIMKAINDYKLQPRGIILECPFGSMYHTVANRFKKMGVPTFPMAGLLVFWGGIQNSYWAFGFNPVEYAKHINCPVLLLYGDQDKNVSRSEINELYQNLPGKKTLRTFKLAGHENYLIKYRNDWIQDVDNFFISQRPMN